LFFETNNNNALFLDITDKRPHVLSPASFSIPLVRAHRPQDEPKGKQHRKMRGSSDQRPFQINSLSPGTRTRVTRESQRRKSIIASNTNPY